MVVGPRSESSLAHAPAGALSTMRVNAVAESLASPRCSMLDRNSLALSTETRVVPRKSPDLSRAAPCACPPMPASASARAAAAVKSREAASSPRVSAVGTRSASAKEGARPSSLRPSASARPSSARVVPCGPTAPAPATKTRRRGGPRAQLAARRRARRPSR